MKKDVMVTACGILATVFTILGTNLFDMSLGVLILILCVNLIYILIEYKKLGILRRNIKKKISIDRKNELKQLLQEAQNTDAKCDIIAEAITNNSGKEVIQNNDLYKKIIRDIGIAFVIMLSTTLTFGIVNYKKIVNYVKIIIAEVEPSENEFAIISEPSEDEIVITPEPSEDEIVITPEPSEDEIVITLEPSEDEIVITPEPSEDEIVITPEPSEDEWVKFKLEYPDGYPEIDDNEYKELYTSIFYIDIDLNDLSEKMDSEIAIWLNSCTPNTPLDKAVTSDRKSITYFVEIESNFSNKGDVVLSSDLLDEVIMGRNELLELYPNGTLAWILANHMQTYALNYLYQPYSTKDENSIIYLYMKTISYTQKSLEYEMDTAKKCERISYIQSRYKDIAECKIVNSDIRLRAYEIYTNIQDALDNLEIS